MSHRRPIIQDAGPAATRRSARLDRIGRLGVLLATLSIVALALRWYGLSINVTDSMPMGLYHLERVHPPVARGTIVQACLPESIASIGRRQGYLLSGSCPADAAPVLKIVVAAAGDRVLLLDGEILVNGQPLPGSATKTSDARGRRLLHIARGAYTLEAGELWFWTPNPVSWDSRYYGPVPERHVQARATLLFSFGPWAFGKISS